MYYYEIAAKRGHGTSMTVLAMCYEIRKKFKEAFALYYDSVVIKDFKEGYYYLARCYFYGIGCDKDKEKARYWALKAHEYGDEDVDNLLKLMK
ncbi:MAG: hypothetical protein LUG60_11200 [Erysipelotrichaceae bacterium]|nr:hypothetical protein [Erysipelotrichaceae bacterium]